MFKKLILTLSCLSIVNIALAGNVSILNKDDSDTRMEITYQICKSESDCSPEATFDICGGCWRHTDGEPNETFIIKSAIEIRNNRIITKTSKEQMCKARFDSDNVIFISNYSGKEITCRLRDW